MRVRTGMELTGLFNFVSYWRKVQPMIHESSLEKTDATLAVTDKILMDRTKHFLRSTPVQLEADTL